MKKSAVIFTMILISAFASQLFAQDNGQQKEGTFVQSIQSTKWTNKKLAHVSAWAFLRLLGQYNNIFGTAGDLKVRSLPNLKSSEDIYMLSSQLHNMFVQGQGAVPSQNALVAMRAYLTNAKSDTTLADFANDVVDKYYKFRDFKGIN